MHECKRKKQNKTKKKQIDEEVCEKYTIDQVNGGYLAITSLSFHCTMSATNASTGLYGPQNADISRCSWVCSSQVENAFVFIC